MGSLGIGRGKYFILLALSAATAFVIPVVVGIYFTAMTKSNPNVSTIAASLNSVSRIGAISGYVGNGVLLFAAMRLEYKRCLPFALITDAEIIASLIILYAADGFSTVFLAYTAANMILQLAVPFADIAVVRLAEARFKKEAAAVVIALLLMFIAGWIVGIVSDVLIFWLVQMPAGLNAAYGAKPHFSFIPGIPGAILKLLNNISLIAAYLILRFIFAQGRLKILRRFFIKLKAAVKKLWAATAA